VLADYRRYLMPVRPYTFALRVMHYGRYGSGGEDDRLQPLFVGYPNLVRGYDVNSFSRWSAVSRPTVRARLRPDAGQRVAVANLELRFPPFGAFAARACRTVPSTWWLREAGVAWNEGDKVKFDLSGADGPSKRAGPCAAWAWRASEPVRLRHLRGGLRQALDRPLKNVSGCSVSAGLENLL
jgi:hypothetical protein